MVTIKFVEFAMRYTIVFPLTAGLALQACAVGPDYKRPVSTLSTEFKGQVAIDKRVGSNPADIARWWEGFNDPLLSRLVQEALVNNLDIAQAAARSTQARAGLDAAAAVLLPSASIGASGGQAQLSERSGIGAVSSALGSDRSFSSYEANIATSWELDLAGGLDRQKEAALAEYQASEAGVVAARLAVIAGVADAYILIRGLQARLAIARAQVKVQEDAVRLIRLRHQNGVAAESTLRAAEASLAQVRTVPPAMQAALESALNAMDVLLGSQPGTHRDMLLTPSPIPGAPAVSGAGGPAELLRRRPDLIIAERRLAAANARIGQSMSEYFPKFSFSALLGTASTAGAGSLFTAPATQAQGFLGLRWRLFDFGRIDAEIKSAKGAYSEALAAYRSAVLRASQDVEDAFAALVNSEEQERLLAQGEASLQGARNSAEAAFARGTTSKIEVLDAEFKLLTIADARVRVQTASARSAVLSFKALGGGWETTAVEASGL